MPSCGTPNRQTHCKRFTVCTWEHSPIITATQSPTKNGLHISIQVQVGPPLLIQAEHMLPMAVRVSQKMVCMARH